MGFYYETKGVVVEKGWVVFANDKQGLAWKTKALLNAERGVRPSILDNGIFFKVSEEYEGEEALVYRDGFKLSGQHHVFIGGRLVEYKASRPLHYSKWAPEDHRAAFFNDEEECHLEEWRK